MFVPEARGIGYLAAMQRLYLPILVKGPVLASLYPDPTERNYAGLDLLVPPETVGSWDKVLMDAAYQSPGSWAVRWGRDSRER